MKKWLFRKPQCILLPLLALVLLGSIASALFYRALWAGDPLSPFVSVKKPPFDPNALSASQRAELVVRGKYLAQAGDCIACHTIRGNPSFSGGLPIPTPFGTLYTPNITPDKETGIGSWSSDDFYRAMHAGRSKDGSLLYPAFPFTSYTRVTREDSDAMYTYIRSLPAVHQANRENEMRFPFNQRFMLLGWRLLFFSPGNQKPDTKQSAEWNRGAYLVEGLGHCAMCHTSINPLGGPNQSAAFAGGLIPLQNWYAPSLTSDAAGLGNWNIEHLDALLKTGVSAEGAVFGPMSEVVHNSLQYLSDDDIHAMSVYLKTLPQKKKAPHDLQFEPSEALAEHLLVKGKQIYTKECVICHAADGKGKPPAYPPLAHNASIQMPSAVNAIRMVLNGGFPPSTIGNPEPYGMPPFAQQLSDEEIAAVVTYIRMTWNPKGAPVSPKQVNQLRSAPLD